LEAEMTEHLGYEKGNTSVWGSGNIRTGLYPKTVLTDAGGIPISVPRDRQGTFDPALVPKRRGRIAGFNDLAVGLVVGPVPGG
jgi:putative transposase